MYVVLVRLVAITHLDFAQICQLIVESVQMLAQSPEDPEPLDAIETTEVGSGQVRKLAVFENFNKDSDEDTPAVKGTRKS